MIELFANSGRRVLRRLIWVCTDCQLLTDYQLILWVYNELKLYQDIQSSLEKMYGPLTCLYIPF